MSDKVETKIIQIMPAEPGWEMCCYKVIGDHITVAYQPVIGWALVSRRVGHESDMEGVPVSENRVEPLFIEPGSAKPIISSDLYAFRLWGLISPGEPRVEAEVIEQIRAAIETRSNEE